MSARLVHGEGGLLSPARMVCHCLLIETDDGLVLVDTGLGLKDVDAARERLGLGFILMLRPRLDREETAAYQVERLGFKRKDVRHIVPTHLDLDHAGGLGDFPDAVVHVFEAEHRAAMRPRTLNERMRYKREHWAHGPRWVLHELSGESWRGFYAVTAISGVGPDVMLVPLVGHTRGHSAVVVKTDRGHIMHAGDAYFSFREVLPNPTCPPALAAFQTTMAVWNDKRLANQRRLRQLHKKHPADLELFSAHCPYEFDRLAAKAPAEAPSRRRPEAAVARGVA